MQSKELKERLGKLQEIAEQKAYKELVKDITKHDEDREYFSSYKNSLGFGKETLMSWMCKDLADEITSSC